MAASACTRCLGVKQPNLYCPATSSSTDCDVEAYQFNPLLCCTACCRCIQDLLSELSSILSDSSASMQASEGLSSNTPAAAKWWKQRVALDSRLSALLKQLDQDWLGPWRCLMMQPGQQQEEQAAAQKALEFVAEHFDFVFGENQVLITCPPCVQVCVEAAATVSQW